MSRTNHTTYTIIQEDIKKQIFSGKLRPGDLLDSESKLCEKYGVSRETVRKALKQLVAEHLIYSKPKVGYFVSSPNHGDFTVSFTDTNQKGAVSYPDIKLIHPDQELLDILNIPSSQGVLEFSQLTKKEEGICVSYDKKYIPYVKSSPAVETEMRFSVFPDFALSKISTFSYYSEIEIKAVPAGEQLASVLNCPKEEPLLLVEQTFKQHDGKTIAFARHYGRQPYVTLTGISGQKNS